MRRIVPWSPAVLLILFLTFPAATSEMVVAPVPPRPRVPGKLLLHARERKPVKPGADVVQASERNLEWDVAETAIIICDMWDDGYCKLAVQRVGIMVPRMNQVVSAARSHGVMVIHSPSNTMNMYADSPHRRLMKQAKPAQPPVPILAACRLDKSKEPPLPVDTSKCACDDPVVATFVPTYSRQHPGLDIVGYDGISDSGQEMYNFFEQEGIKNVVMMGVHANMCVLERSFGIRQWERLKKNVVLVRDLTDAMYDPRQPPYVSHARGTELVIEHIERYWCPSILAEDLTRVVPGSAGPSR
jgi:nicotinamidase-related amidase